MPRKSKNGNGNGDRFKNIKERLEAQMKETGEIALTDIVDVSVVAMFYCQKLGFAFPDQIIEKMRGIHADVNEHIVKQALEALRARQLLSYASGTGGDGQIRKGYKPRQAMWGHVPEVAHVKDLLPALVSTKEASELIGELNDSEVREDGEKKKKTRLGYDDYVECLAEFVTLTDIVGSQPESPRLKKLVRDSDHGDVEAQLRFCRDPNDGAIVIPSDVLKGWLRTGLRTIGLGDAAAQYIGVSDAKIYPKKKLDQLSLPVIDKQTRQGKGLNSYELLSAGETFSVKFRLPTKGVMGVKEFKLWLAGYGPNPLRGLSPARGARFGKIALIGFELLGRTRDAETMLRSVADLIPKEARAFFDGLQKEAVGVDLRKGSSLSDEDEAAEAEAGEAAE